MRRPACHARRGEHGRAQVHRDAEHVVHEAGVQVDVGAQDLARALLLGHDLRRHALDVLEELELALELGALRQARGVLVADDGARVGERVHRVAHAVDQARAVAGLLAHNAAQVVGNLALVGPVVHMALDVEAHLAHLAIGAAVLGTLERADGAGVGRVGVGAAGGEHAAGERGVVAAAVLCLQHEHDVEHVCLVVGVCVVGTQGVQNRLGGGEAGAGAVPHHVAAVVALLDGVVRKHGDARHARDEAERGVHLMLEPGVVGRGVGGVEMKHAAAQHVHHVFGGAREDVVVHEAAGQVALVVE